MTMTTRTKTRTMAETSAARDLREKLAFERQFTPVVQSAFRAERKLFRGVIITMGLTPAPRLLATIWRDPLAAHYDLVAGDFADLSDVTDPLPSLRANVSLQRFVETSSLTSASTISATSARDMQTASALAAELLREEGQAVTNAAVAAAGSRILARKQHGREDVIIVTETQTAAEGGKAIGANARGLEVKVWQTVQDGKVRPAHVSANGQRTTISGAFVVGGERLLHPGDRSLGASVGNVAYCRCAAIYR